MNTSPKLQLPKDAFDYIYELGQRFPELSDWEVCSAYEEYTGVPYLNPDSFIGALVLQCFFQGTKAQDKLED